MNVVIMVCSGYPHKFSANNSKSEFIARGLLANGCRVAMCDGIFGSKGFDKPEYGTSDSGVDYCIAPMIGKYRAIFHAIPVVWNYLKERKVKGDINHVILPVTQYPFFFVYWLMAILLGYKRSALFHEWHGSLGKSKLKRLEGYIRDFTFGYFLNTIFPISHFLDCKSVHFHRKKMILPIMAAFDREPEYCANRTHFAYCCGGPYLMRNPLVLDAFTKVHDEFPEIKLVLIISGNKKQLDDVYSLIDTYDLKDSIIVKNQIPQSELYHIYDSAIGLLIPMDPANLQDKARFSQKIAEYIATKRPIITSEAGEIPYYFENNESAVIVPFSVDGYYQGMKTLISDSEFANNVGNSGYVVGLNNFDYKVVAGKMIEYMK